MFVLNKECISEPTDFMYGNTKTQHQTTHV